MKNSRNRSLILMLASLLTLLICVSACSNAENTGFDPAPYIKSVDSKIEDSDDRDEAVVTVTVYNNWEDISYYYDRNMVRQEANSRGLEEAGKYGDDVYSVSITCVDEDGNLFDINMEDMGETFISTMRSENFLPAEVISALPDDYEQTVHAKKQGVVSTSYIWNTYDEKAENPEETDIHNIQMTETMGEVTSYVYKNYYFDVPKLDTPMSTEDASKTVDRFAKTFINDYNDLTFDNDPESQIQSLYDPGHIETWTAISGTKTYDIVMDLDTGSVIYYKVYEEKNGQE